LTPHDVERMMRAASTSSNAAKARAVLRIALNRGMKMGDIARNVAMLTDAPEKAGKIDKVQPLSPKETAKFLDTMHGHRLKALFIVALGLRLREAELLGLGWQDVDSDHGLLTVHQQVQRIDGKLVMTEPKSRTSRAVLPMIGDVTDASHSPRAATRRDIRSAAPMAGSRSRLSIYRRYANGCTRNLIRQGSQALLMNLDQAVRESEASAAAAGQTSPAHTSRASLS